MLWRVIDIRKEDGTGTKEGKGSEASQSQLELCPVKYEWKRHSYCKANPFRQDHHQRPSCMGAPTDSIAIASIALWIFWSRKPHHYAKVRE